MVDRVARGLLAAALMGSTFLGCGPPPGMQDPPGVSPPRFPLEAGSPGARTGTAPPASRDGPLVPVLRVVDGDTIHVLRGDRDVTIRLIGIDTPEVDWYGGRAECFGARAGRFLIRFLENERVGLEFDQDRLDPYDRTLAYVYLADGRMLNELLVRRGFAIVTIYEPNDRHEGRLRSAQAEARSSAAGLWSACG